MPPVHLVRFLVKLGPILSGVHRSTTRALAWIAVAGLAACACGYRPAYGGTAPAARLSIKVAPSRAPESGALSAIIAGLRAELSRAGALSTDTGYPRVVVELVRVNERGTAQTLTADLDGKPGIPLASGALVGVTARAWVEIAPGQVERDTGDIRRTSAFGSQTNPGYDAAQREAALASAGRAVGEALGRRIMGEIEVTQEPM